ncbi:hypothetical protein CC80DRAFT_551959 [Byssothecium circinans]|uniref:Uncharacterized protein n=1 Tax=Byssothecium circinans TaxID=147558 RepID=A0A6A5TLZ7_9PLEO|nr:hypothetical protein CC80DRAFT_551959 [Byssothecium circinans]
MSNPLTLRLQQMALDVRPIIELLARENGSTVVEATLEDILFWLLKECGKELMRDDRSDRFFKLVDHIEAWAWLYRGGFRSWNPSTATPDQGKACEWWLQNVPQEIRRPSLYEGVNLFLERQGDVLRGTDGRQWPGIFFLLRCIREWFDAARAAGIPIKDERGY